MRFAAVALLAVACATARVDPAASLSLTTSPRHVYKTNDAKRGDGKWESFVFRVVVRGSTEVEPESATLELRAAGEVVKTVHYSAAALSAVKGHADKTYSEDGNALYDLRFAFKEPAALGIDQAIVTLDAGGATNSLVVPVGVYAQKTKLRFPINGDFMVVTGPATVEGGHEERSQFHAYDVVGLGPNLELLRGDAQNSPAPGVTGGHSMTPSHPPGTSIPGVTGGHSMTPSHPPGTLNPDFIGYGRDVMAPAAGVVVYARNDVADNPASGNQDMPSLLKLPDPPWGVAGNCVVIDHENGEFSLLAHMQPGSVRVHKGDRVEQGDVLGKLGNSGATTGPHLHYHLMDGAILLKSDGLPAQFENTCVAAPKQGQFCDAK